MVVIRKQNIAGYIHSISFGQILLLLPHKAVLEIL